MLWILAAGSAGPGVSYMDRIDEVSSWTAQTPGGRPLIVLRGRGGHLLGIDDDGIFALGPSACGGQVISDTSIGGLRCRFTLEGIG